MKKIILIVGILSLSGCTNYVAYPKMGADCDGTASFDTCTIYPRIIFEF